MNERGRVGLGENIRQGRNVEERKEFNDLEIKQQMRVWFEYLLACVGFLLLCRMSLVDSIPMLIPLLGLLVYESTWIIRCIFSIYKSDSIDTKRWNIRELFIAFSTTLFYILMFFYILDPTVGLIYSSIPLLFQESISMILNLSHPAKFKEFSHNLEAAYRWTVAMSVLFTGLKTINAIKWNWFFIFWPVWVFILVLFIIGISQVIYAGKLIYNTCKGNGVGMDSICPLWLVYFSLGCAGSIGYLFYIGASNKKFYCAALSNAILVLLLYLISLFVITFLFNTLIK